MPKRIRLAARRRKNGYSQEAFAEALQVDRTTVARWEAGETNPQPWQRRRIAKVLGVSLEELDGLLTEPVAEAGGFAAAAALTEMAGWMAHDMGRDQPASQHLRRALDFARAADDSQLHAQVFASVAHLADHRGEPAEAMRLAEAGERVLQRGPDCSAVRARLVAMQARAAAAVREPSTCVKLLARAEQALDAAENDVVSPWVSTFDEASLAGEAARCLQRLGDHRQADERANRVMLLRPDRHATRSRAFALAVRFRASLALGELEMACAYARDAWESTAYLGSHLVLAQLGELPFVLDPYRGGDQNVADLLDLLKQTLPQRRWLQERMSGASFGRPAAETEPS